MPPNNRHEPARDALIVACDEYADPGLRSLRAPAKDAEALAGVLADPEIGAFDVDVVSNLSEAELRRRLARFFAGRGREDLLLVHFSCHGLKDDDGILYFAATDTELESLDASAVSAEFVARQMTKTRSRSVVLSLDCCYSGAFPPGVRASARGGVELKERFGGSGRAILTASSGMEYAFEGTNLVEEHAAGPSLFTSALVHGLSTGAADRDRDGRVSVEELYEFVAAHVGESTSKQTPKLFAALDGTLFIANNPYVILPEPSALPAELQDVEKLLLSTLAPVRAGVVEMLVALLAERPEHEQPIRTMLERLAADDDPTVARSARRVLGGKDAVQAGKVEPRRRKRTRVVRRPSLGPVVPAGWPQRQPPPPPATSWYTPTDEPIGGRYRILDVLASRPDSAYLLAKDERLERTIALKQYRTSTREKPDRYTGLQRAILAAAKLSHPNIVAIFDSGLDDAGRPYIAMAFVDGPSLADYLAPGETLGIDAALDITRHVLTALDYAHRQGVVHGHLEPGSVLLAADRALVSGFGEAYRSEDAMLDTDEIIGLADYLSPQQAMGEPPGVYGDLYCVGLLLYRMLTGEPPFTGDNAVAIAMQHVRETAIPPSQRRPGLEPRIDAIVQRALAKNARSGYESAERFLAALEGVGH